MMTPKEYNAAVYVSVIGGALCIIGCIVAFAFALAIAASVVLL